jgi:hypothetical protein
MARITRMLTPLRTAIKSLRSRRFGATKSRRLLPRMLISNGSPVVAWEMLDQTFLVRFPTTDILTIGVGNANCTWHCLTVRV